jgi:hypothetical protein
MKPIKCCKIGQVSVTHEPAKQAWQSHLNLYIYCIFKIFKGDCTVNLTVAYAPRE